MRYEHDCNKCVPLGEFEEYDLYFCLQGGNMPTVIARFSDDGPDYYSGLDIGDVHTCLAVAEARARSKGLLVSSLWAEILRRKSDVPNA